MVSWCCAPSRASTRRSRGAWERPISVFYAGYSYVNQGRGVTLHREDCGQVVHWRAENSPRLLQVSWGAQPTTAYSVQILVRAFDRRDLIRDISTVLSASETQVTDISSRLDENADEVSINLKVRVRDFEQLSELLSRLGSVSNVIEARRLAQQ